MPAVTTTVGAAATEAARREALGIPPDAPQVLIVAESTHWDPDWLLTSREYFRLRVRRTIDRAIDELLAEPRRVYDLECLFYPDLWWEARPDRRDTFRDLVNTGRLRFTGCGVTTPDTLLPEDELLLRDLLLGQEWLRARGMEQEPRLLYLPDSFGHSPGTPALLAAAGIEYAAICRIDGMFIAGAEWEPASHFPRPGTTAALLTEERSADFVWRGADGSEVLAHWHAHGYGHGDMLAHRGLSRWMGLPLAVRSRGDAAVAARIERVVEQLGRLARTPYLLLSIGFDFVDPVPRLVELLDRWNERHYERTGVWTVSAGLDDHLDLVAFHRDRLPVIELDPNPYWTGFYASRPALKRACRDLGRRLIAADAADAGRVLHGHDDRDGGADRDRQRAWWLAATTNHHDFVTGTSPDRVTHGEQWPWVREATRLVDGGHPVTTVQRVGPASDTAPGRADSGVVVVTRVGTMVEVATPELIACFDEGAGGTLASLRSRHPDGSPGPELLGCPALELVAFGESGGLWRMGHELAGGRWREVDRSTRHRATVSVAERDDRATVVVRTMVAGRAAELAVRIEAGTTSLLVDTVLDVPDHHTVALRLPAASPIERLTMHQPGGLVERPLDRWYDPTFWPLHSFAIVGTAPMAVATAVPTAIHAAADGEVLVVVGRNAPKERIYGVVPEVGQPAKGLEREPQQATLGVAWPGADGPGTEVRPLAAARALVDRLDRSAGRPVPTWPVTVEHPDVEIISAKPAHRGPGIVVRLRSWAAGPVEVEVHSPVPLAQAAATDSRERDLPRGGDGTVERADDHRVRLVVDRHLTSVRLVPR